MGIDTVMVALDSNAMTYFIEAMNCVSVPPAGDQAEAKIALARIFFYLPHESCFRFTPTVELEYLRIRDKMKKDDHRSWTMTTFRRLNHCQTLDRSVLGSLNFKFTTGRKMIVEFWPNASCAKSRRYLRATLTFSIGLADMP